MEQQLKTPTQTVNIEITETDSEPGSYHVNYQKVGETGLMEIEGMLIPYNTGRCIDYKFEPGYFDSPATESYFDENWETIEDEMLEELNRVHSPQ